jgi:DNA-binding response OmpR family regulator
MKLLLVLGSDDTYKHIASYVQPLGFELIRYQHVLKAMDNIDEIDPSAIIISARDFPRHWKTLVQFIRNERSKDTCPIIILKCETFSMEEASKASFLGVSGIVTEALDKPEEVSRLQGILSRYMPVEEKRRSHRIAVEPWQRFGFIFTVPKDKILATGQIKDISLGGLSFLPDNSSTTKNLSLHTELTECSLRVGDVFLSPVCRVARTGRIISLEFLSFPEGELETLGKYIMRLPLQKLRNMEKSLANT